MPGDPWFAENLAAIRERLREAEAAPPGLIFVQNKANYRVLVFKTDSQIRLYFANPAGSIDEANMSGIMSRIDVEAPLRLLGAYTQVMMLALIWNVRPRRAYMLGFGGARVPLVLHHYFPDLLIESTELDSTVVSLAHRFFGIAHDPRLRVFIEDGRRFLEVLGADVRYDMIFVDCYTGAGHHPFALSTTEFYDHCKAHLSTNGVVVTNLVENDPLFRRKVDTFSLSFRHVMRYGVDGVNVFFGSDVAVPPAEARARAERIYEASPFPFPFRELVKELRPVARHAGARERVPLSDATDRSKSTAGLPPSDPIFYGAKRNDACPCGSGQKFKKCHGR